MLSKHHAFRLYRAAVLMLTFDVNVNDDNFLTKKIAYYSRILVVRGTKYMGQVLVRSLFVKFSEFIKSFKS